MVGSARKDGARLDPQCRGDNDKQRTEASINE
jgi:hypothetical protein